MIRLVRLLIDTAGITKVRITGGEPLLSPKFDEVYSEIMQFGLEDVSLTTNGQLLSKKIPLLLEAGLKRINVSLDTLSADKFRSIARSGDLATVLSGIEKLQSAGVRIKINMVPMKGINDDQILPMLEYCMARGIELRFIELMNMGHLQGSVEYRDQFFAMADILALIETNHSVQRIQAPFDSTAVRYSVDTTGAIGIIANESEPFCQTCSRLRLSSNGKLYGCLSSAENYDLTELLAMSDNFAVAKLQRLLGLALGDKQTLSFRGEATVMKFIGG
jgi:cyclic pyranopterin phosphate synthase